MIHDRGFEKKNTGDRGAGIVVKCRLEDIVSFILVNLHFHHYNEPTGDMVVWSLCGLIRLQQRGDTLSLFQISNDLPPDGIHLQIEAPCLQ